MMQKAQAAAIAAAAATASKQQQQQQQSPTKAGGGGHGGSDKFSQLCVYCNQVRGQRDKPAVQSRIISVIKTNNSANQVNHYSQTLQLDLIA